MSDVEKMVCNQIMSRAAVGLQKYGVSLANAGLTRRQILIHAQQEAMDLAGYIQTELRREDIKNMKAAVVYHRADFDGKLSMEVCRWSLEKIHKPNNPDFQVVCIGWDYGDELKEPWEILGPDQCSMRWEDFNKIYVVDLSVDALFTRIPRSKIIWIDHHKSAIEKWDSDPENQFDGIRLDGVAACRLCWEWFCGNPDYPRTKEMYVNRDVSEPRLLRLAGEYDVWDHRDPDAKALQFGLRLLSPSELRALAEGQFEDYGEKDLDALIAKGWDIMGYCNTQNASYAKDFAHTIHWEGLTFCALNLGQRGNSDLFTGAIKPEHQALFAWRFSGKEVIVSLYHAPGKTDLDLSEIAVKHGGGGHRGACGFRTDLVTLNTILCGGAR
jgi:uncharacterized protein